MKTGQHRANNSVSIRSNIAESFPLRHIKEVSLQYRALPADTPETFYHYTSRAGLEGILRDGGFRAAYRMSMNDPAEFSYARGLVFDTLDMVGLREDLLDVVRSLPTYTRKNLENMLSDSAERSDAYCACLSFSSDSRTQWHTYAENGNGFAIGFDLYRILQRSVSDHKSGKPYIFCNSVIYNERKQRGIVEDFVIAGIRDLQAFADTCSNRSLDLTAARDKITFEIVLQLFVLINFMKAPHYCSEREMRLFLDPNKGTLESANIQYYQRRGTSVPFVFVNLYDPITDRLPIADIKIGPSGVFADKKRIVESLLDELGYGNHHEDRPQVTRTKLASLA